MKLKTMLIAMACACSLSSAAQFAWDPNDWSGYPTNGNTLTVNEENNSLIDKPGDKNCRGDLRNSSPINYSPEEGYILLKFRVNDMTEVKTNDIKVQITYIENDGETSVIDYAGFSLKMTSFQADTDSNVWYAYFNHQADGRDNTKVEDADGNSDYTRAKNVFQEGTVYELFGGNDTHTLENGHTVQSYMSFILNGTKSEDEGADPYFEILNIRSASATDVETGTKNDNVKDLLDGTFGLPAVYLCHTENEETTQTEYSSFESAWSDAVTGDIIRVNKDQNVSSRLGTNGRAITVVGNTEGVRLIRNTTAIMFLLAGNNSNSLTFEDIIIDGNGKQTNTVLFEINNNAILTLKNSTIKNATCINGALLNAKQSGNVNLTDATFTSNCNASNSSGDLGFVFMNDNRLTISGNNKNLSISLGTVKLIGVSGTLTNEDPIKVYLGSHEVDATIVSGYCDASKFTIASNTNNYQLVGSGSNVVLKAEDYEPVAVNKNRNAPYADIATAIADVTDDETIVLNADAKTTSRIGCGANFTIRGGAEGVTLTRGTVGAMMFLSNSAKTLTLENLILDGNQSSANNVNFIESSKNGSAVVLNNVAIKNAMTTNGQGLFVAKNGGKFVLNNVTTENCSVNDNLGVVYVGKNSSAVISGNNSTPISLENASAYLSVAEEGLTNETPLTLYLDKSVFSGKAVVYGCSDASKFSLVDTGTTESDLNFLAKDGNLVLTDETASAKIGNKEYVDFVSAWNDAVTDDEIILSGNATVSATLNANGRSLKVVGNKASNGSAAARRVSEGETDSETVTITRDTADLLILANQGETVTLEDLTLDGANVESSTNLVEASNGSTVNLTDVTVSNASTTDDLGLLVAKTDGTLNLTDVTVDDSNTVVDGTGSVFFGTTTSTISGDNNVSITVEKGNYINASDLTNTTAIDVYLYNFEVADGQTVVSGTTDTTKFNLVSDTMDLVADEDGNLIVTSIVVAGVEGIEAENNAAPVEYYNLQGVRVENPAAGIYLRKQGNTVSKVALR